MKSQPCLDKSDKYRSTIGMPIEYIQFHWYPMAEIPGICLCDDSVVMVEIMILFHHFLVFLLVPAKPMPSVIFPEFSCGKKTWCTRNKMFCFFFCCECSARININKTRGCVPVHHPIKVDCHINKCDWLGKANCAGAFWPILWCISLCRLDSVRSTTVLILTCNQASLLVWWWHPLAQLFLQWSQETCVHFSTTSQSTPPSPLAQC